MAEAGILSAPVLDAIDGHPASNWLGFLDVSDIVTALLKGAARERRDSRRCAFLGSCYIC